MRAKTRKPIRWLEAAFSAALTCSFFLPWLSFLGSPVAPHEIRERLEGPHRLASLFTKHSQISLNYSLAPWLYAVPATAGLLLLLALSGLAPAWAGLVSGGVALIAFLYIRREIGHLPFQHLETGAYLALAAGLALILLSLIRLSFTTVDATRKPAKRETAAVIR